VFNEEYLWAIFAGSRPVTNPDGSISIVRIYSIYTVTAHKIGHTMGLGHDEQGNTVDMMDPYYDHEVKKSPITREMAIARVVIWEERDQ